MGINKKQSEFFHEIINSPNRSRSYNELSALLGVSIRSIRNYCTALEDIAAGLGIKEIMERTSTGITYTGMENETRQILSRINTSNFYEYHLSPDDRILSIVLILLDAEHPVTVMELCDTLFVSRATILNDIEKVKLYFKQYHVAFEQSTNRGYRLQIEEPKRQEIILNTCFPYLKNWNPFEKEAGTSGYLFDLILDLTELIPDVSAIVQEAERKYGITIADTFYKQTVFTFALLCKRLRLGNEIGTSPTFDIRLLNVSVGDIARFMLSEAEHALGIAYSDNEVLYLAWRLHTCHFDLLQKFEHSVDLYFYMEVWQFLQEIENDLQCSFSSNQNFAISLTRHIWSVRNNALEKDTVIDEKIIHNYPEHYKAVKDHIGIIESSIGRHCTETDMYYILLYVVAELENQTRKASTPRVVVLCHVGIGTGNYLANRLLQTFNIEISDITATHKLQDIMNRNDFDLLISTVPLKMSHVNWVTVSPNLEDDDIIAVQKALASVHRQKRLTDAKEGTVLQKPVLNIPFARLLKPDHVILDVPCANWHEALEIAAIPLLKNQEICPGYVDAIIRSVEMNGPYFVFYPGIALAHAAPADGVRQFCLSIYRPENPVCFRHEKNDPVRLIVMIGITDVNTQVNAVSAIISILRQDDLRNRMLYAQAAEEIIAILSEMNG
ncbi:BglG family transcription antiterminator [Extibacter muris]|uniref:BglG family transcription antiterminator n=1 Tax=Extibacter muris TaxID=1796622 RepID=UPI001D09353D|nr:PTS sugar transporter subunit IIA [Extibacter muris]MCB6203436.1 PTS sugar transporter subunit IIA [Extibacter muris]MCQ4665012.1 PTS sugar transporter subunit IIA [Extibacter muris]MCQ4694377.1 PTS sugar transporter subunit IIA [Extibacter muris]